MKIDVKKTVMLAMVTLALFSCNLFSDRYDPLERGKHIYLIDNFHLPQGSNSSFLFWDAWGKVDNEDLEIYVAVPPSLNMEAESLVADISIYNAGLDGDHSWFSMPTDPTVWGKEYRYPISRHDFDPFWEGEALFEVDYDIYFVPVFESSLRLNSSFISSVNSFHIELSFNDTAAPGKLGAPAFIGGLKGTNCDIPANQIDYEVNYSGSTLPNIGSLYSFALTAVDEGEVNLRFSSGAVLEDMSEMPNISSNEINMYYDASPPVPSTTPFTVKSNEAAPDYLNEIFLDIDYSRGSDQIQSDYNIEYLIVFSDAAANVEGDLSNILTNYSTGTNWMLEWWSGYDPDFYRTYEDLQYTNPDLYSTLSSAPAGTAITLYFNILLRDHAYPGNTTFWDGNTALYSATAVPVTFHIPTL